MVLAAWRFQLICACKLGVSVDLAGDCGSSSLIVAASNGQLKAVKFLVEHKASVDQAESAGWTGYSRVAR